MTLPSGPSSAATNPALSGSEALRSALLSYFPAQPGSSSSTIRLCRRLGSTGILAVDSDGDLVFPASHGLIIHNSNGWHSVSMAQGLRGTVYSVLQDREGTLWIGLAGRGLVRWAGYKQFEAFTSQSGLSSDLVYQTLPEKDGSIWVGTESGLSHGVLHNATYAWTQIPAFAKIPIHTIQRDLSGDLWLGTETLGLARFDPITQHVTWFGADRGLDGINVSLIHIDRAARIWIASQAGLYLLAPPYDRAAAVYTHPAPNSSPPPNPHPVKSGLPAPKASFTSPAVPGIGSHPKTVSPTTAFLPSLPLPMATSGLAIGLEASSASTSPRHHRPHPRHSRPFRRTTVHLPTTYFLASISCSGPDQSTASTYCAKTSMHACIDANDVPHLRLS